MFTLTYKNTSMKIYFLFIACLLSLGCLAQKKIVVKDLVSVKIPAESNIASKISLLRANSKNSESKVVSDIIESADAQYLYSINGITFYLFADNQTSKKDRLRDLKGAFDEMARGVKNYDSKIISNSDKAMLWINNGNVTSIYIYNKSFSKFLSGMFIVNDGQDVTKLVNQIYNSVNFDVGTIK